MEKNDIKKILIIRLSALGDTIHTLPLANSIRKKFPNVQLDWIVEDKAAKFIVNNPLLNNVYVLERKKWKKEGFFQTFKNIYSIIKMIKKEQYDLVIDTQQLFKSSIIMGLSNGKRKLALDGGREFSWIFANEIVKTGRKQFDINYHVVERNLEIAKYLACEDLKPEFIVPDFSKEYSSEIMNVIKNIEKSKKTILIAPATTWQNKHWTIQGWVDVISELKDDYNILITAMEKEKKLTEEIISKLSGDNIIDLSGKTSLSDIFYICKNVDLVISPDSGSAHVAWASMNPYIITLFFATSKNRTAPYGEKYFSVSSSLPCSPCMKKHCHQKTNKNKCIQGINPKEIINIVKKVLQ